MGTGSVSVDSIPSLSQGCSQVSKGRPLWAEPHHSAHCMLYICHIQCGVCLCVCMCVCVSPCPPSAGLPASEACIKVNDMILEVEGIDVTRASGQVVVDLIR